MTRAHVKSVLSRIKLPLVSEDVNGITIRRQGYVADYGAGWHLAKLFGAWLEQQWRIQPGGGIAGNSDKWFLAPLGCVGEQARGPFATMRQLETAIRRWRKFQE